MSNNSHKSYVINGLRALAERTDDYSESTIKLLHLAANMIYEYVPNRTEVEPGETRAYMLRWLMNSNYAEEVAMTNLSHDTIKQLYLKHHG